VKYQELEQKINIKFTNRKLLENVFIHKSYLNEISNNDLEDNERLEFLGDAVLELVVTEFLYLNYKNAEGELTNWRSALVKGEHLAKVANELQLGKYLFLSRGEENSGGRKKNYLLANTLEAFIGAIYLDKKYEVAKEFINQFIIKYLEEIIEQKKHIDAKSLFQEMAQEKLAITPEYRLESEEGPDHSKIFTMGAYLGDELISTGEGPSKQKAEVQAADRALEKKGWHI